MIIVVTTEKAVVFVLDNLQLSTMEYLPRRI
jgi:hypothetical protein